MSDPFYRLSSVAPFPAITFRDSTGLEHYLREFQALRGTRWLYEQSLATHEDAIFLNGTCGLCLVPACFMAPTRNGEIVGSGQVPNWREGLICDCDRRLINRERALLHYLLQTSSLQHWMHVLGIGELGGLRPLLTQLSNDFTAHNGPIDRAALQEQADTQRPYHLIVLAEHLDRYSAQPDLLSLIAKLLVPGGCFVFTAPFDANANAEILDNGPIGIDILSKLNNNGFVNTKASLYWSEEFGYLGPFNFIFSAAKGD